MAVSPALVDPPALSDPDDTLKDTLKVSGVAKRWGSNSYKVLVFINAGLLEAIDISLPGAKRPRYRITRAALAKFEAARSTQPPSPSATRRKRRKDPNVRQYF